MTVTGEDLGTLLMRRLIEVARSRDILSMHSTDSADNDRHARRVEADSESTSKGDDGRDRSEQIDTVSRHQAPGEPGPRKSRRGDFASTGRG